MDRCWIEKCLKNEAFHWREQATDKDAQQVASRQLSAFRKASPQRDRETAFVREPAAAACNVILPRLKNVRPHIPAIERVIARHDYSRLYYSTFFWVEGAWRRLKITPTDAGCGIGKSKAISIIMIGLTHSGHALLT
jgi:hypothetical protein